MRQNEVTYCSHAEASTKKKYFHSSKQQRHGQVPAVQLQPGTPLFNVNNVLLVLGTCRAGLAPPESLV